MKTSFFVLIAAVITLSACNTFQGMGRDVEAAGEAISGTATKTKEKM